MISHSDIPELRLAELLARGETPPSAVAGPVQSAQRWLRLLELARPASLGGSAEDLLQLLIAELELRQALGLSLDLDDYAAQHPHIADRLRGYFADAPQRDPGQTPPDAPPARPSVPPLPGYRIIDELGRGGMGVVFRAEQVALKRAVALKLLRGATTAAPSELSRFRAEAEAIARLQHPHIIQIYEVGEWQESATALLPYFSMELCAGSLEAMLREQLPEPHAAARLLLTLALAMQHAHNQGVIHRDLKPANILLQSSPATGTDAIPKIADFGLAKQLDAEHSGTPTGAILGTPSYLSPEQADGLSPVGAAADVYGLGAILYECLTGRPPFRASTPMATINLVLKEDPLPPRRLQPGVPLDLEIICLKCLHKSPAQRYASAAELAADLQRFLDHQPIVARAITPRERLVKWARRNPALAGLLAVIVLSLNVGVAGLIGFLVSLDAARSDAVDRAHDAHKSQLAAEASERKAQSEFARAENENREMRWQSLRAGTSRYGLQLSLTVREATQAPLPITPTYLVDTDPALRGWEYGLIARAYQRCLWTVPAHKLGLRGVAFSPDGALIASSAMRHSPIRLSSVRDGKRVAELEGGNDGMKHLAFSPDGQWFAAGDSGTVFIWNLATKKLTHTWQDLTSHSGGIAWQKDSLHLLATGDNGRTLRYNVATGKRVAELPALTEQPSALALAPNERWLAFGWGPGKVSILDLQTSQFRLLLDNQASVLNVVAWSPSSRLLAAGDIGGKIHVWDVETGKKLFQTTRKLGIDGLSFIHDDSNLLSACFTGELELWDLVNKKASWKMHHGGVIINPALHPRLPLVATGAGDNLQLWNVDPRPLPSALAGVVGELSGLAFQPDGKRFATGANHGLIQVWDADKRTPLFELDEHRAAVAGLVFAAHQPLLLSGAVDGVVKVWDIKERKCLRDFAKHVGGVTALALHPEEKLAVNGGFDGKVRLTEVHTGKLLKEWQAHAGNVWQLAFRADGQLLATVGNDNTLKLWRVDRGTSADQPERILQGHSGPVRGVAWTPDARTLVSCSEDRTVRIWDAATGEARYILKGHRDTIVSLALTPDGKRALTLSIDHTLRVWDITTGQELIHLDTPPEYPWGVVYRPHSQQVYTSAGQSSLRLWEGTLLP